MKTIRLGFVALLIVGQPSLTHAQSASKWQASVDALWVTAYGNDDRIGDVISTDGNGAIGSTTTLNMRAIAPQLGRAPGLLVEARYRGGAWGYGGRGWRVSTDGDAGETVTPQSGVTAPQTISVRLWNQTITPFLNNQQVQGRSPLTYHASNEMEHVRVEGYAERLWLNGPTGTIAMRFGVAYAHANHNRHADLLNIARGTTVLDETLATTEETRLNLAGPLFALAGDTPFRKLHLSWLLSPSALIGTTDTDATFEITDITPAGASSATTILRLPWSETPRAFVPALDLQMKAGYAITPRLDVGGAILSSTLFGLPVTPAFDDHTGGWNRQTRDVSFLCYSVFARFGL